MVIVGPAPDDNVPREHVITWPTVLHVHPVPEALTMVNDESMVTADTTVVASSVPAFVTINELIVPVVDNIFVILPLPDTSNK
jgi:hypothetical protein